MKIERLTQSEELVMKAAWDCLKDPELSDVLDRVNEYYGKDWKPQTVSTFLAKLVRKNYLELRRDGKIYTYKILIPENAYKQYLYKKHIAFWNQNSIVNFLMELFQNGDLKKENLTGIID